MSATVLRLVEASDDDPGALRRALLSLLAEDRRLRGLFKGACRGHVLRLRDEASAFRFTLSASVHSCHRSDGLEGALYGLALDLLPDSLAAAWVRLQTLRKNRGREADYPSSVRESSPMVAIEDLLANDTRYATELALLAMSPPDYGYLREVAAKFWSELRLRGHEFDGEGFADHVWAVLRELFPASPGAAWDDEWAAGLMRRALRYVADRHVEGAYWACLLEEDEISSAAEAEDRARYRAAVHAWACAALRRIREAQGVLPTAGAPHEKDGEGSTATGADPAPVTTCGAETEAKKV